MDTAVTETIEQILKRQRDAFDCEPMPDHATRRDRLDRIGRLAKAHAAEWCDAISRDFGNRSRHETLQLEIAPLMASLRHARWHLRGWMRPERRSSSIEFLQIANRVEYQPLGVVGIMVPWNYPLLLALGPLVDVLAAGNRAMIKPSELLPESSALLKRLVERYFSLEEVAVVEGGVDVAAAFSALPFDHLLFTGSTAVGRKVMAAAAQNLTPVTLELGGKSPALIAPDYPVEEAARDIAFGKLMNAGQTCIAPDYVLVPREKLDALSQALLARFKSFYPRSGGTGDYSTLVGARALDRLTRGLDECRARGVSIVTSDIPVAAGGMQPALVLDPPADCLLMEEEIFGPVLPLVPYDTVEDALRFIRQRPRPLALYLFTRDNALERKALAETRSGNVTINGTLLHIAQNDLPFGGVGPSGMGFYHGFDGFKRFSHARGIARVRLFNPARLAMPPYGRIAALLARFMTRG
ncbi:coniferyl aldehyde dehydrogenase [Rhizobium sp.]